MSTPARNADAPANHPNPLCKTHTRTTDTAAGDHADRGAVHDTASALTTALDQPDIAKSVAATIVTKIKKS